jgi:hypothetical protein
MRDVNFVSVYDKVIKQIQGSFLTVGGDRINTMTIGWATLGIAWRQPMMVMVRNSATPSASLKKRPTLP